MWKIKVASVVRFQPGRIHIYRWQVLQYGEIVPYLCVIAPQKLVGGSSHVNIERLALTAFSVEKLKHWFIFGSAFQVYPHNIEKGFA
jgi:hypothetical protein